MQVELALWPSKPLGRDVVQREVGTRLGQPDVEGTSAVIDAWVGRSARCQVTIRCAATDAEVAPRLVERLDLLLEVEEAQDVEPLVDRCYELADALRATVRGRDGDGLDPHAVRSMVQAGFRSARRTRLVSAVVGLGAIVAGGIALYGLAAGSISGVEEVLRPGRVRFLQFGGLSVFLGICFVIAAAPGPRPRRDRA
ncbi:MAG: hypothetical protein KF878_35975 [Planctomycetes bacterium]|nr:hypothetical protein [Planctomycetota bacterium]